MTILALLVSRSFEEKDDILEDDGQDIVFKSIITRTRLRRAAFFLSDRDICRRARSGHARRFPLLGDPEAEYPECLDGRRSSSAPVDSLLAACSGRYNQKISAILGQSSSLPPSPDEAALPYSREEVVLRSFLWKSPRYCCTKQSSRHCKMYAATW